MVSSGVPPTAWANPPSLSACLETDAAEASLPTPAMSGVKSLTDLLCVPLPSQPRPSFDGWRKRLFVMALAFLCLGHSLIATRPAARDALNSCKSRPISPMPGSGFRRYCGVLFDGRRIANGTAVSEIKKLLSVVTTTSSRR